MSVKAQYNLSMGCFHNRLNLLRDVNRDLFFMRAIVAAVHACIEIDLSDVKHL